MSATLFRVVLQRGWEAAYTQPARKVLAIRIIGKVYLVL